MVLMLLPVPAVAAAAITTGEVITGEATTGEAVYHLSMNPRAAAATTK